MKRIKTLIKNLIFLSKVNLADKVNTKVTIRGEDLIFQFNEKSRS